MASPLVTVTITQLISTILCSVRASYVNVPKVAVLFYREGDEKSAEAAEALEGIDDDLDGLGVLFVKNSQPAVAGDYGIDELPTVVVFERGVPNLYEGDLTEGDRVLDWIVDEVSGDDTVEVVTDQGLN